MYAVLHKYVSINTSNYVVNEYTHENLIICQKTHLNYKMSVFAKNVSGQS